MKIQTSKTQEHKNNVVADNFSTQQSSEKSIFEVIDNRPEFIAQAKLKESISSSSRVRQLKAYHEIANNISQTKQAVPSQVMTVNSSAQQQRPIQRKENKTGLPDKLKFGIENLSGHSMDNVKVHYNSDKPGKLQAHAYAQGTDIHIGSGQQKHLAHEAWHVVQQMQGRVKSTMQMKDVAINNDSTLEQEADVMGNKASKEYSNNHEGDGGNNGVALRKNSNSFSQPVIQGRFKSDTFKGLLEEQRDRDELIKSKRPKDEDDEKGKASLQNVENTDVTTAKDVFTTVGFEHEFAAMAEKDPFNGVPHIEISESKERFNGLPFILETDAGNALELVSPPFWIRSVDQESPIPDVEEVEQVDDMMKDRLKTMVDPPTTMSKLVGEFKADPGLSFELKDATVKEKNISFVSRGKYTKDNNKVAKEKISEITIGKITKFKHGGIDTQINIATDGLTYGAITELASRTDNKFIQQFYDYQKHLKDHIETRDLREFFGANRPLKTFVDLLIRNIAGQLAVPSMRIIKEMQRYSYQNNVNKPLLPNEHIYHMWTSSGVKDVNDVWIKDNIINIGIGMLSAEDWSIVLALVKGDQFKNAIKKYDVAGHILESDIDVLVKEKNLRSDTIRNYYSEAKKYMIGALHTIETHITDLKLNTAAFSGVVKSEKRVDFMEHDPNFIGPRQDTYVPSDKVSLPEWKQRLHVVELRENPIETLRKLPEKMRKEKEEENERIRKQKEKEMAKPFYKKLNDITSGLPFQKKGDSDAWILSDKTIDFVFSKPELHNSILTAYSDKAKWLKSLSSDEQKTVLKNIDDLFWQDQRHQILILINTDNETLTKKK